MGSVVGLWRYPVKSTRGERLHTSWITPHGLVGDRGWAVLDGDGNIVSAKHPDRGGRLLLVGSRYADATGDTTLQVPRGAEVAAGSGAADEAITAWLGRPVRLSREPQPGATLRRWWPAQPDLVPEWNTTAIAGTEAVTSMAGPKLRGSFVDYGAVHVVFTDDLRDLERAAGCRVDPQRFRANIVIEGGREFRDARRIRIGGLTFDMELPTPRCAVPGLSPQDAQLDSALLRVLARHDRRRVGSLGTAACFGVYATSEIGGTVRIGDLVSVVGDS